MQRVSWFVAAGWVLLSARAAFADVTCQLPATAEISEPPVIAAQPVVGCAIAPELQGRRITALSVRGVPDAVAPVVCEALHPTGTLDQFTANEFCTTAKALRIFETVQLTAAPKGDDVAVQLALTVAPRIVDVALDPASERDPVLLPLLETRGAVWAADRIELLRSAAEDLLIGAGYPAAALAVTSTRKAAGMHLTVKLTRGRRASLDQIVVIGNHAILKAEVERLLGLDNPGFNQIGGVPSLAMVQRYFLPRVQTYYRNRGYLEVRLIDASLQPSSGRAGAMALVLTIAEGRRFSLAAVVDESRDPHPPELAIQLQPGSLIKEAHYNHILGEFLRTAAQAGFIAYVGAEVRTDVPNVVVRFSLKRRKASNP